MPERSKKPRDLNELAAAIVGDATGAKPNGNHPFWHTQASCTDGLSNLTDGCDRRNDKCVELTLGLLADAANMTANKKMNVLGVFSNINVRAFPAAHPLMQLVLRFSADPVERGQVKVITIQLVDQDGQALLKAEAKAKIPENTPAGRRAEFVSQLGLANVIFQRDGGHVFKILVNGDLKGEVPFTVTLATSPEHEVQDGDY